MITRAWRAVTWTRVLIGCGVALAAVLFDAGVTRWLSSPDVSRRVMALVEALQSIGLYLLLCGILASFRNRWRLLAGFLVTVITSAVVLHALKWAIGRARPRLGLGPLWFAPFSAADEHNSFPSGHAMAAGTVAGLLGLYFPRARWVFYGLAGVIGVERIANPDGWHFLSDVVAGFGLAAAVIWICYSVLGPAYFSVGLRGVEGQRRVRWRARSKP